MLNRIVVFLLISFLPGFSLAGVQNHADMKGFVVNVSRDGMLIVSIEHRAEIVRLAGIAYPDEDERGIDDIIDFVRAMVLNKTVRIERLGKDQWGNILGRIYLKTNCLNEALIHAGLADPAQ